MKPLLTYASPVWGHAAKTNINLLETAQNLIRQICNAHWYMRNKDLRIACNIPTIRRPTGLGTPSSSSTIDYDFLRPLKPPAFPLPPVTNQDARFLLGQHNVQYIKYGTEERFAFQCPMMSSDQITRSVANSPRTAS
ncbi:hypothetical protein TNCV_3894561 [Trichonephila clavipes]|nr:hypothetical protein TNCV_3894561 [Trichonephila clavipes]